MLRDLSTTAMDILRGLGICYSRSMARTMTSPLAQLRRTATDPTEPESMFSVPQLTNVSTIRSALATEPSDHYQTVLHTSLQMRAYLLITYKDTVLERRRKSWMIFEKLQYSKFRLLVQI